MSITKHTPGPWRLERVEFDAGKTTIYDQSGTALASTEGFINSIPNARLIAAAPELLVALKEALRFVKNNTEDFYMAGHRLIEQIEKAIAKAEGK